MAFFKFFLYENKNFIVEKLKSKRLIVLNIILIFICFKLSFDLIVLKNEIKFKILDGCISEKQISNDYEKVNLNVFNLSKSLVPIEIYQDIKCKQSIISNYKAHICIHDLNKDIYISKYIWELGVWENNQVVKFIKYLKSNPDYIVIDAGANIGVYSLFAAKMGHDVISIEPFYENILRIHKASSLENTTNKITVIQNALSNRRNEIKKLGKNSHNVGGQGLLAYKHKKFDKNKLKTNKYLVETILFDDIIPYLPKRNSNKAILKIDIEGFESYAFQYSKNIFKNLDFDLIFMEWGNLGRKSGYEFYLVIDMVNFLFAQNLRPFDLNNENELKKDKLSDWPWDIVWKKLGI